MSTPADRGILGNSKQAPLNKDTVEKFARSMADEIVRSVQMETVDVEDLKESQAQELASRVIETAVREASRGQNAALEEQESKRDDDSSMNPIRPAMSQSGLPVLGSLDYPDAPPSTPLLPGLEKSRQSFTRKLKGGLAKEFMPSPPPPTPKEDREDGHFEPEVELIEHLMHSLTTEQSGKDRNDPNGKMVEFAEAVSWDIMECVHKEVGERCSVELLAEHMAQAIVHCSMEETRNV